MKARLEILLAQIDAQIKAITENYKTRMAVRDANEAFNVFFDDVKPEGSEVFMIQNSDGSYPLVPLLCAKAQILSALAMIQMTETT